MPACGSRPYGAISFWMGVAGAGERYLKCFATIVCRSYLDAQGAKDVTLIISPYGFCKSNAIDRGALHLCVIWITVQRALQLKKPICGRGSI